MLDDEKPKLDVAQTAAIAGEVAETGLRFIPKMANVVPGAEVAVSALSSYSDYSKGMSEYDRGLGVSAEKYGAGYTLGEYDPFTESEGKQYRNASLTFGKGITLAVVGFAAAAMIPATWPFLGATVLLLAVTMGMSWIYDQCVSRSAAQDPMRLLVAMKQMHETGQEVPKELMFGVMVASLSPDDPLRAEIEGRLKQATGDHKLHHILDNPAMIPAVSVIMQDPSISKRFCDHYQTFHDANFFDRVAGLYAANLIDDKSIVYAHSCEVALACQQDQMLEQQQFAVRPPSVPQNLPPAFAKSQSAGAATGLRS